MSKCLHIPLGEQYRKHVRVFYRWKKMMEGGKAEKNKSRKSSKTAACKSKITSVKNHNIYVKSSMTHSSHSAKCLTPAAVLIRCSACCCGVLLGLRLLGCAVKKEKKKKFFIELLLPQICSTATSHGSKVSFQKDTKTKTDEESHISLVIAVFLFVFFFSLSVFICDSLSVLLYVKSM